MNAASPSMPLDLARPSFVFALALLLANDLVLKAAYPGWVTGKLSDFAGLFVLPYFLAWLWPSRRLALHVGVALAFVAWKLPLSRPFVELWNAAPWFDIARVEDLTDLWALPSVWFSHRATGCAPRRVLHLPNVAIALVALLAVTATSRAPARTEVRGTYVFLGNIDEFHVRLVAQQAQPDAMWVLSTQQAEEATRVGSWYAQIPRGDTCPAMGYEFDAAQAGPVVVFELRALHGHCATGDQLPGAIRDFNAYVARPMGLVPARAARPPPEPLPQPVCTEEEWAQAREKGWFNCKRVD